MTVDGKQRQVKIVLLRRQERRQRGGQQRRHADHQGQARGHHRPGHADRRQRRPPWPPSAAASRTSRAATRSSRSCASRRTAAAGSTRSTSSSRVPTSVRATSGHDRPRPRSRRPTVSSPPCVDNSPDGPVFDALWTPGGQEVRLEADQDAAVPVQRHRVRQPHRQAQAVGRRLRHRPRRHADPGRPAQADGRGRLQAQDPRLRPRRSAAAVRRRAGPLSDGIFIESYWLPELPYPGAAEIGQRFTRMRLVRAWVRSSAPSTRPARS